LSKGLERLPYTIVGFFMVLGILFAIGVWYLALFALALLIFLGMLLFARAQHKETHAVLQFRPGKILPAQVWEKARNASPSAGTAAVEISFVELDKYRENWLSFRQKAQVERPGPSHVQAYLVCFRTPTADRGVLLVFDRLILGEVRQIDLASYFDLVWARGGVVRVDAQFDFDHSLEVASARCVLEFIPEDGKGLLPAPQRHAFNLIWRAVRGKGES
jgi:hypothetical protein